MYVLLLSGVKLVVEKLIITQQKGYRTLPIAQHVIQPIEQVIKDAEKSKKMYYEFDKTFSWRKGWTFHSNYIIHQSTIVKSHLNKNSNSPKHSPNCANPRISPQTCEGRILLWNAFRQSFSGLYLSWFPSYNPKCAIFSYFHLELR